MTATTTSASDLISGALLNINAYAPGQVIVQNTLNVCLQVLNDLLDSLSNDQAYIFTQQENILAWTPGQYQYSIGNPVGGTFAGYLTTGSAVITGVTVPSNITVGGTLSDVQAAIPAGTTVLSFSTNQNAVAITFTGSPTGSSGTLNAVWSGTTGLYLINFSDGEFRSANFTHNSTAVTWTPALTGAPTTSATVNINTVTMSANATQTLTAADTITYTVPGNFGIARPLRIRDSYTRVTTSAAAGLDYWFDCQISFDRYKEIGYKTVPGPWPYEAAYLPTMPYGSLRIYPNPTIAGQVFLYTDMLFTNFTTPTQAINLPQGYARSLKKLLALELCPIFGKTPSPLLISQCKEAKDLLKAQNIEPIVTLRYDSDLVYSRHNDAGWITHGGFV
jgi:hypothetical protein